ncbi:uncharacterized protein LOC131256736 [Magnolia sinica]|uniref:uncharacterized protein LOC131256736 n=1 Tax=Magnolia sinica TaxID=86752 RepID=UPI00265A76A9|nr:uncharacterized protein LOC131256736 [Magnolia sinica]
MHFSLSSLSTNSHHSPEVHKLTYLVKMQASKDLISSNPRNPNKKNSCCAVSLLERDEIFFNRLLSREPSMGFSSRIYYRVAAGNVPFEWEVQPGKPKVVPEIVLIPPLSPPPAMVGSVLALPPCDRTVAKGSTRLRLWFRKKKVKSQQSQSQSQMGSEDGGIDRVESFGFWSNEGDWTWSPPDSSSSSSSSSLSSSSCRGFSPVRKLPSPESQITVKDSGKRRGMDRLDWAWRCGPWSFAGVMVCMAKGV